MANKQRILLVDDHEVVRLGLKALLDRHPNFEVVAEAATAREAVERVAAFSPDVVVMDIRLPGGSGIELQPCGSGGAPSAGIPSRAGESVAATSTRPASSWGPPSSDGWRHPKARASTSRGRPWPRGFPIRRPSPRARAGHRRSASRTRRRLDRRRRPPPGEAACPR